MGRDRHATVVAYLALVMAMSGTAYALTVDGGDVVNSSLTGRDIRSDSIPEGDLGFDAVSITDNSVSNFSSQTPVSVTDEDGPKTIASVETKIGKGMTAAFGIGTYSITNHTSTPAPIEIRPYMDGKPHGEHFFIDVIQPGTTNIDTVSILCDAGRGTHTFELRMEVFEGGQVTIGQVEWGVWPVREVP